MSRTYEQLEPVISALDERIKTGLGAFPTDTAEGSIASFSDGADGIPLKSLVVDINPVQSGSGDPSPDNVRPISGWTGCEVQRTGVNVWDEEWEVGTIAVSTGANASATDKIRSANYIPCVGNTSYCFLLPWAYIFYYDADYQFISYDGNDVAEDGGVYAKTKTTPSNARYMRFRCSGAYGATYNHDISINYPSTDHDYHPYTGRSITINLGQTVYGGKLDVLSGVLTVDRAMVDLGTLSWITPNENRFYTTSLSSIIKKGTDGALWIQSSIFRAASLLSMVYNSLDAMWLSASGNISVSKIADTVAALKTAVTGQQLVYELATPIEIQLSATQINSLYGVNNIWADTGDTEVEYRADTKLYIERLTEPDADMIADANITSGSYFMVGNTLYKATANIANGGQIIVGTNCTKVSLATALNEINA